MAQTVNPSSNPLLDYMLGSQGKNTAKTVNDILQGTGLQNTYNTQVAVGNQATQSEDNQLKQILAGPINGQNINPTPIASANNLSMIKDSSMPVNLLLGILSQASALQQNGNNNATSIYNNSQNNATTQRGQNLQYSGTTNGTGLSNGGTGNPRIDNYVTAIMNGSMGLKDVPQDLQPTVAQAMTKAGYNPAKAVLGSVAQLQSLYDSMSPEDNPYSKVTGGLGDLLTHIGVKTPGEKAKQDYVNQANQFASQYGGLFGNKVNLPSVTDSKDQALKKFDNIVKTLHNTYFQGNAGPVQQAQ